MPANNILHTDMSSARSLCWSCRQEINAGPFCKHCVKIQPIEELGNYFDLFGIEKSYNIDLAELKKSFFELSREFHPDFYSNHAEQERIFARNNTAYLNTALKALSDPLQRAEYLLSLAAGSFSSAPAPPQELFEEILEIGELVDFPSLSEKQRKKLARIRDSFRSRQLDLIDSLGGLFEKLLGGDKEIKGQIESRLDNIKYLRTILARISTALTKRDNNER